MRDMRPDHEKVCHPDARRPSLCAAVHGGVLAEHVPFAGFDACRAAPMVLGLGLASHHGKRVDRVAWTKPRWSADHRVSVEDTPIAQDDARLDDRAGPTTTSSASWRADLDDRGGVPGRYPSGGR
jgi:hypothetical protein